METILDSFLSFLLLYKYVGLFIIAFVASLPIPLPSSSVLAAAGAFAAQGYFDITTVLIVAFLGNFLGDTVGYLLARIYGVEALHAIGLKRSLSSPLYLKLKLYIQEFSYSLIFFSRFLTGVCSLVNVLSGLTRIRYVVFFSIEIIGEIAYVLLYGLVGYFLGSEWEKNIGFVFEATLVITSLGVAIVLLQYGLFRRMKILHGKHQNEEQEK
jgi:membrane-associated protein